MVGNTIRLLSTSLITIIISGIAGCTNISSELEMLSNRLMGESFKIEAYNSNGDKTLDTEGTRVFITPVKSKVRHTSNDGNTTYEYETTDVLDIKIDENDIYQCGDTIIALENGIIMTKWDFDSNEISSLKGIVTSDNVLIISGQDGKPIGFICGDTIRLDDSTLEDEVNRVIIDNKSCYMHRAKYKIVDIKFIEASKEGQKQ